MSPYEWQLGAFLDDLSRAVRSGTYVPQRAEIIRSGKGTGLTRALAFLAPRDALLYRAIVGSVEGELLRAAREWTGFRHHEKGDSEKATTGEAGDSYEQWWNVWLRKQGGLAQIVEECDYVVESDVSNFFPSIDLEVVREHLLNRTSFGGVPFNCERLLHT